MDSDSNKSGGGEQDPTLERYRTLFQFVDVGLCVIEVCFDANGRPVDYVFLETNPAFVHQTGLPPDVVGKRMRELAPAHEEHWFEIYGRVAVTGEPQRFVQEARALDRRWFDVYAFRIEEPKLRRVAVAFSDITERVRAEQAAKLLAQVNADLMRLEKEEDLVNQVGTRVADALAISQLALVELRPERGIAYIENCWHRPKVPTLCGEHPINDAVVQEFRERAQQGEHLVVADILAEPKQVEAARFAEYGVRSFLIVPLYRHGGGRDFFIFARPEPSEWTHAQQMLAAEVARRCWERIQRLRAEAAVRSSEEHLRLIVENAREYVIFTVDTERRILSWNIGAERMLGFTAAEVMGKLGDLVFTPEDRADGAPAREVETALRDGRANNERWHVRKDGTRFWGSGIVMAMRDDKGKVRGLLKIMRDQTEERSARAKLEESRAEAVAAGQAKDRFLAALSHELRTPLNPVLMIASEAEYDKRLPPEVRRDFATIRKNVELEARLIDDMLDLSRIQQAKLQLQPRHLRLHELLRETLTTLAGSAADKRIIVQTAFRASHDDVRGDPARLQQVFLNLVGNAIKFTPEGGQVTLETRLSMDRECIEVVVTDSGIGLSEDELQQVFEPFAQGRHASSRAPTPYGGLGLGLSIARGLAEAHDGSLSARSSGPGGGAQFAVRLPTIVTAGGAGARHERPAEGQTSSGLRILLVEDHADTRNAVARMLERRQHAVTPVASLAESLRAARDQSFDVMICDIGLPDGDGWQLLQQIRALQPTLPAIALSGYGMANDVARSSAVGFSAHLIKPIVPGRLFAAIAALGL